MSDRFDVKIVSTADTKGFRDATTAANQMGQSLEQVSTRSGRAMQTLRDSAVGIGAALGTVTAGLAQAGRAAYENEREIDAIRRAYGDASDQILTFSERLQDSTNFSDEQARQAALTASSLSRAYGLQADSVQTLIARSADLAQVYGISLTDATNRLSAAVRGEAEAAELLGITLNDTYVASQAAARGITGWTTTMTDAEKAAFRYTLLLEQTASFQGAAADAATGARGAMADIRDGFQDATVAVGRFLGPMGEALSMMGSMALIAPAAGAGIGKFVQAGGLGVAGRAAPYAAGALIGGGLAYGYLADDVGSTPVNTLANQFFFYMSELINAAVPGNPLDKQKYIDQMAENAQWDVILQAFGSPQAAAAALGIQGTTTVVEGVEFIGGERVNNPDTVTYTPPTTDEIYAAIVAAAASGNMTVADYLASTAVRGAGFLRTGGIGVGLSAPYSGPELFAPIDPLGNMRTWTGAPVNPLTAPGGTSGGGPGLGWTYAQYGSAGIAMGSLVTGGLPVFSPALTGDERRALLAQRENASRYGAQALSPYLDSLGVQPTFTQTLGAMGNVPAQTAMQVTATGSALESTSNVIIGQTNAIGQQIQTLDTWARKLINVEGIYGQIDDLLSAGTITLGEYNAAQEAGNQIFAANEAIQQDILTIQAKQAPLLGDLAEEQAAYIDELSKMPAQQQLVALGLMDVNESMKAQQVLALAAAAANGELGSMGEEAATAIITGMAQADPVLKEILISMGLINETDGEITVNYDAAKEGKTAMDDLIGSIESLIGIIAQAFHITITSDAPSNVASLNSIVSLLNALDGRSVTYYVNEQRTGVSIGSPSGPGITPIMHGGVVGYANGGVIVRMAEAGPELLRFSNGGTAWAMQDGLYNVPRGTYVTPAPASRGQGGSSPSIVISGPVTIMANDPRQLYQSLNEYARGGSRL